MTVEDRAQAMTEKFFAGNLIGQQRLAELIAQALRDQIEECAKVADKTAKDFTDWSWPDKNRYAPGIVETAESIAEQIRAFAEPEKGETEARSEDSEGKKDIDR